jgi:Spy/CpxP family protein refolding chaperone
MSWYKWLIPIVGLALTTAVAQQTQSPAPTAPEKRWERWIERLQKHLELTPQQQEQLRTLLRQRWEQQQREREQFRQRLKEILTPEQWEKLQQVWKERKERIRERLKERRQQHEGPPYY